MLLEREELLGSLRERLDEAKDGSGSMVLVAGEAGAGKTSLVRAFVASLDDAILVIQGACDPLTTPRPLSPLYDFASDPDSGLSDLASGERDTMAMFREVLDRLRHTIRPIVMVIEDVHWADEASLDFLRFIGRRVADSQATLICTYRDDEVGLEHPLRPVLGQLIPLDSTHRLVVPPLSIDAIRTLIGDLGVDAGELLRLTDGNAFFVTELLATGETTPHTVQEAVLGRVGRLAKQPRRVVEAVSIAPRSLDIEQASALAGATTAHIDAALAAGVLEGDGPWLRFRHELARSAVEESLPPARRLSLHRRMLRLLNEEQRPDLALMAHHAVQAGDSELILEHAPAAAREASQRGSHKEAASFFGAAIDHRGNLSGDEEAELRVALARELSIIDRTPEAIEHIDRAVMHYRHTEDVAQLTRALISQSNGRWRLNDLDGGWASLIEARELLEGGEPTPSLAEVYYNLAYKDMLARKGTDAMSYLAKAESAADSTGYHDLDWDMRMLEGCLQIVVGNASKGVEILDEVRQWAREEEKIDNEVLALSMLGSGGGEARRYEEAIRALDEGVELGVASDQDYSVSYSRAWLARVSFEQGRWDEAVAYADLVDRRTLYREGISILTGLSALGRVRIRRGDPGGLSLLEDMVELGRSHELQHAWNAICGRAEHFWLAGDSERGLDELEPAYRRALDTESEWARGEIGFWMWRIGAIDGPPEGAAEPYALQMSGDWRAAAEAWRQVGCPYEVAMALADGDANSLLEALEIFDTLGARPMSDRVRASLRRTGVESVPRGPIKSTRGNPAGLTNRQLEVLELMTEGLSNGEIAERLFIAKKTVEHHVSAILSKLGVDSRAKAIATADSLQ